MEWSSQLTAAAGLIAVAAFTPGPNNVIVMHRAAEAGLRGTWAAIAGVVVGGLALLGLVALGGGALFAAAPGLRLAITVAGAAALAAAGALMMLRCAAGGPSRPAAPARFTALVAMQFLNPKSWIMSLTAVSAVPRGDALAMLAPLFVVIPAAGLILWSALGAALVRLRAGRPWFDRAMGALLVASAALLVVAP